MTPPPNNRFQILALSGGGYRGLFGAEFLTACEQEYEAKCVDRFDLIAGTSIGALLATGLAVGRPALELADAMREHGPRIFAQNFFTGVTRTFVAAPYKSETVEAAILDVLGVNLANTQLDEIDSSLIITAVNYSTSQTTIFRSRGIAGKAASAVKIKDAILASAAAPTYFPTRTIEVAEYLDGGLVANAPDMIAILDAMEYKSARLDEMYQLSIGTAGRREGAAVHDTRRAPGSASWVARRGLVQTIMAAQEHLALTQSETLLKSRFLRIDEEPAENQVADIKDLDRASAGATKTLELLASQAWERTRMTRPLRDFFIR
jgi:patatin-like phospholipase/acyl hydrolase